MRLLISTTALVLACGAQAQDWTQRVQQRWPGASIRKATERDFEAWLREMPLRAGDKAAAARAFVDLAWDAHGLPAHAECKTFLSPGGSGVAVPGSFVDDGVPEGPEPNGDPNAIGGGTPTRMGCGDQGEGAVFPYGDRDWWQIDLTDARTLVAWTGPGTGTAAIGDTMLEVYDAGGSLLAANDDDPRRGHYSALSVQVAPGRYYVAVRGFADVRVGSYAVDVACWPPGSGGPRQVQEGPEPNSSPATATPLPCGRQGIGDLQPGSESDWWSFSVNAVTDIDAETGPHGPSPCRDTYLYLRNSAGTVIASDDDGGSGLYSRITIRLQPGTYYLDMQSYANAYAGGYTLDLRCGGSSGPPASFTAHPGGCPGSAGTPTLSARSGEVPIIGATFALELDNLPGSARAFPFFGFSTTRTSSGLTLPFDLGPLGAPGCRLEVDPERVVNVAASPQGRATVYLPVPYDNNLLGVTLHTQALVLDAAANALGVTATNRGELVVGSGL